MNIVIIKGFQYLDLGNDNFALLMDDKGEPVPEDITVKRWVRQDDGSMIFTQPVAKLFH